jgi:bifunctional ADP-heptose synthase (sugar kinase/adenylyltransferase)
LDTRTKIHSYEDALESTRGKNARWVSGRFDPLLAAHAHRLAELSEGADLLIVTVMDTGPDSILPVQARAQLVAALASVDCVVIGRAPAQSEDIADGTLRGELAERGLQRHKESA